MFTVATTLNSFRFRTYKPPPLQPLYNQHLAACLGSVLNKRLISSLESALTQSPSSNPFRIRTYKKQGGTPLPCGKPYTRSATVPSILWKKNSPPISTTATPAADASSSGPGACPCPVSAHRNPSITPAMGFRPYSQRHRSGTSELGYATGDANIQNCTANGTTYLTSRYSAFSADIHNPTPSAVSTARSSNRGSHSAASDGLMPYTAATMSSTTNPMAKSTSPDTTAESGSTSRGKYTLVMTRWLSTTTLVQLCSAVEKYAQ